MRVYLVWHGAYDDWGVLGVYATEAGAQRAIDLQPRTARDMFGGNDAEFDYNPLLDSCRWQAYVGDNLIGHAPTQAEAQAIADAYDASENFSIDEREVEP